MNTCPNCNKPITDDNKLVMCKECKETFCYDCIADAYDDRDAICEDCLHKEDE